MTTGIPAAPAARTASFTADGSASETAMPWTLSETAWLIASDCAVPVLFEPM